MISVRLSGRPSGRVQKLNVGVFSKTMVPNQIKLGFILIYLTDIIHVQNHTIRWWGYLINLKIKQPKPRQPRPLGMNHLDAGV